MATSSVRYDPSASYEFTKRDVEYRRVDGQPLLATVWQPQGAGPFPAILNLHGGAWNNGDRSANPQFSEGLVRSGVVVVSIDFRHGASGPYPASLVDINYATRWLKANTGQFNADASTVGGIGVSSGGHLIVLAAMRPHDPRYAADPVPGAEGLDASYRYIIPCWGVLNPYARYLMAKEQGNTELIANHDHYWITAEAMQEGNPVMILQRGERVALPPCLVVHPEKDQWMSVEAAQSFASLYQAAGGQCELAIFKDMPHGIAGWSEERIQEAIQRMRSFIAQQLSAVPAAG